MTTDHTQGGQFATFMVGGHHLGIAVLEVQEVLREQNLTRVPLAPEVVAGLINLRGQIVPALNMRHLLGFGPGVEGEANLSVVVRAEHGAVSLHVDEIGDVVELHGSEFEPTPPNVPEPLSRLLLGVYRLKDHLLLVLNTARTLDASCA